MSEYRPEDDNKSLVKSECLDAFAGKYLTSFQRRLLQKNLQGDLSELYRQRILIMLLADEGKTQTEICQILGCCAATVRHWMHIASTGMAHQWNDCPIGGPKAINDEYLERLKEMVSHSPRDYGYSFRRWTASFLSKHLAKELGISVSDRHVNRLLKQMGLSTKPKLTNADNNPNNTNNSKILISDLKLDKWSENEDFVGANLKKIETFETDLNIHGAQFIRSVSFAATAKQYLGLFPFSRGMEILH
jgi:transposase